MFILNYQNFREIFVSDLPIETKIHIFESDISELAYRFWCKLTGGKFERKPKKRRGSCVLVTKRGFHFISNFLAKRKSSSITPSELEVYERNCPENKWGTQHFIGIAGINLFPEMLADVRIAENLLKFNTMIGRPSGNSKRNMQ